MQQAVDRLIRGRTVITVAHRVSTIRKSDRVVMIGKGRVVESGPFDELVERKALFSSLISEQVE